MGLLVYCFVSLWGWLWGLRRILIPCGGNPSVASGHPFGNVPYGQPPLSGEARPKSRLRRLAVGAAGAALWENDLRQGLCFGTGPAVLLQTVRLWSKQLLSDKAGANCSLPPTP